MLARKVPLNIPRSTVRYSSSMTLDPLTMSALKGAFSFGGKKAAETIFKKLNDKTQELHLA